MNITDSCGNVLAIIVKGDYDETGISFFTPDEYSQQLAYMHHVKGHVIPAHVHNEVRREVFQTKEVLVVRKGKLRCDFYTEEKSYVKSIVVDAGDILLLASGGHGFTCLEETEMFEIKQGPYAGEADKTRFKSVSEDQVTIVSASEVEK